MLRGDGCCLQLPPSAPVTKKQNLRPQRVSIYQQCSLGMLGYTGYTTRISASCKGFPLYIIRGNALLGLFPECAAGAFSRTKLLQRYPELRLYPISSRTPKPKHRRLANSSANSSDVILKATAHIFSVSWAMQH